MTLLAPSAAWRARLAAAADAPPRRPRVPLHRAGERIGSVEPDLFERAGLAGGPLVAREGEGWRVEGDDATASLGAVANALRATGLAHTWRNEQVAVRGQGGALVGTIERGVARALGIATQAVHLTAVAPDGSLWLQRRAFDKPTDPGRWDTLVGGLVPATDSVDEALARETWEEAGLRLAQVRDLRERGCIRTRRPLRELAHGYVVEDLLWFTCVLPEGVVPRNQDGEVAEFLCMSPGEAQRRLERGEFALDAALILLAAYGAPAARRS